VAAAEARRALEEQRAAESHSRAQADVARLRAEAETAKRKAEQELAAAETARRAAETETARRRADEELAAADKARRAAEAEAARRKAEQELAAAEKAKRAAEGAATTPKKVPPATKAQAPALPARYQGPWLATFTCPAYRDRPASKPAISFSVAGHAFKLQYREPGQPGSFHLEGAPTPAGVLKLSGGGISNVKDYYGESYGATFNLKFEGERFEGNGRFGGRECTVSIARR